MSYFPSYTEHRRLSTGVLRLDQHGRGLEPWRGELSSYDLEARSLRQFVTLRTVNSQSEREREREKERVKEGERERERHKLIMISRGRPESEATRVIFQSFRPLFQCAVMLGGSTHVDTPKKEERRREEEERKRIARRIKIRIKNYKRE